jgi:hypothetical protein
MQDRYAGDIGDFIKLSLIRTISYERRLGVSWYLYPNELHNGDGRHIRYLSNPTIWRHLDPELFDSFQSIAAGKRSVAALEAILGECTPFFSEPVPVGLTASARSGARKHWFERSMHRLERCDIVFADPDNGLVDDQAWRRKNPAFGKQISLSEVQALSSARCAVIYHHNSRFKGGHDAEVDHWLSAIGAPTIAVRATAYSCRTFFIINPDAEIAERTKVFCRRWKDYKVRLHRSVLV